VVAVGATTLSKSAAQQAVNAPPPWIPNSGGQVRLVLTTPDECNGNHAELYSVSSKSPRLRTIDPASGITLSYVEITLVGETVDWATGLAVDPTTGYVYALLQLAGEVGSELVRLDVGTGVATDIGPTGDDFAGIAFDINGTLYGVTDDSAADSQAIYTISTLDASTELFLDLAAGGGDAACSAGAGDCCIANGTPGCYDVDCCNAVCAIDPFCCDTAWDGICADEACGASAICGDNDGEAIAYNAVDGLIYRASGSAPRTFQTIDPNPSLSPVAYIPPGGDVYSQATALVSWRTGETFLLAATDGYLYGLTDEGVASVIGPLDHLATGLAFIEADPRHALIEVHVRMVDVQTMGMNVVGAQFFLRYDNTVLELMDVRPAGILRNGDDDPQNPFDYEVAECSAVYEFPPDVCETLGDNPATGTIAYAVGVLPPVLGTMEDMDLAVATFRSIDEVCVPMAQLVRYRTLPSGMHSHLLTDDQGQPVVVAPTVDLPAIRIDVTAPTPTVQCPSDVNVTGASCPTTATWQEPRFNDGGCVGFPVDGLVRTHVPDEGQNDPPPSLFQSGSSTVIYSAIDSCGNVTHCSFHVNVICTALVAVLVDLAGPMAGADPGPPPDLTRCITFELFPVDCLSDPVVVERDILFNMPGDVPGYRRGETTLSVPAATVYGCITARDQLHTLRQTLLLEPPSGTPPQYEAAFIDEQGGGPGEALRGGNLNGDDSIDILDFGTWYSEYQRCYDSNGDGQADGHTPCTGLFFGGCKGTFEDISATGTLAPIASSQDDAGDANIPLGFTFNFFGDDHSTIGIASNGYLTFGSDLADFTNNPIPDPQTPNDYIAPKWDDWAPNQAGDVYYQTLGTAPNRRFIAQWHQVEAFGGAANEKATFQAVLFETSSIIEFRYSAPQFTSPTPSTVGVEDQTGSTGFPDGFGPVPQIGDIFQLFSSVHADVDGSGVVDNNDLYGHVQARFFQTSNDDCCLGGPISGGWGRPPVRRISVPELIERGLERLVVADLNRDGWLDLADVAWYYSLDPEEE
jgi:hypothetical protein